ncbi:MAG: GNAT family N-acetyltransferase [Lachnospiraceae bacterium]|nr:GNAT family N-acetyltransferase [Lachnospiraceae bacterium]MBQ9593805.1 GNAT family N-acetyltransferase [Lachnospiraceae bacterium]
MRIRRAEEKDIPRVLELLSEVLEIHAKLRPDIFIPGTTKYTREELAAKFADERTPVFVAADEEDAVIGYAFCVLRSQPFSNNMVPFESIYIDDLCVDESARGQHVGQALFEYVKEEARRRGCYEVTLAVWEGNDSARAFYEKMGMKVKETMMEFVL